MQAQINMTIFAYTYVIQTKVQKLCFRGRRGQEVIFKVAEAKFWISSSFNKF